MSKLALVVFVISAHILRVLFNMREFAPVAAPPLDDTGLDPEPRTYCLKSAPAVSVEVMPYLNTVCAVLPL